jgi:hypothetical protein
MHRLNLTCLKTPEALRCPLALLLPLDDLAASIVRSTFASHQRPCTFSQGAGSDSEFE